ECRLAYEVAKKFSRGLLKLATEARRKSRQVQGYNGYFGKDICEHMKRMHIDCSVRPGVLLLPSQLSTDTWSSAHSRMDSSSHNSSTHNNANRNDSSTSPSNLRQCTHKDKACVFTNCELLFQHGYLHCVAQKTRGKKMPSSNHALTFSATKNAIYDFHLHLFLKNTYFFESRGSFFFFCFCFFCAIAFFFFMYTRTKQNNEHVSRRTYLPNHISMEKKITLCTHQLISMTYYLEFFHMASQKWICGRIQYATKDVITLLYLSPQPNNTVPAVAQQIIFPRDSLLIRPITLQNLLRKPSSF
ncbi:hypothetical protein RFI_15692, partial [Reticulomyxa filosa]